MHRHKSNRNCQLLIPPERQVTKSSQVLYCIARGGNNVPVRKVRCPFTMS